MRLLAALSIATLFLATAACGGTSSSTTTSSATQGRQAGEAFVCIYRQAPQTTAPILVQDYQMWVSGQVTVANAASLDRTSACGKPPTSPLSGAALQAARAVAKTYAESIRTFSPQEVTYLHQHDL